MARILFLHGLDARPGGIKPTYLANQGHTVINPSLPREDFPLSVSIAEEEWRRGEPDVIVGSSRGGAVALGMKSIPTPMVLIAPAWRFFLNEVQFPPRFRVLHSPADELIPYEHSAELMRMAGDVDAQLLPVGHNHTLTDEESLRLLDSVVRELALPAPIRR